MCWRSHLESKASRLRCEAVRLAVRRGRCATHTAGAGSDHEAVAAEDGSVGLILLLLLLLALASLVVGLEGREVLGLLAQHVDHVRHGKVRKAVAPRDFENQVRTDEVIAGIKHADVAFAAANVDKLSFVWVKTLRVTYVAEQVLHDIGLARDGSSLDGVLEELVLLGESNGLLPALVLAVDAGCNLAEEDQVVLLQTRGKVNRIVVVVVLNRVAERLVVLLLDQKVVDSIVDRALVLALHVDEERLDERQVVALLEHLDHTVHIDARSERLEQVRKQGRVLLKVEVDGAVVDLQVGDLDNNLLELLVLPGVLGALNDRQSGVIKLIVVVVAENQLGPEVRLLAGTDDLGQVHSAPEELQVLHETLRVSNTELREHTHVGTLEAKTLLQQANKLIEVAVALILLDEGLQLLSIDDEVETADLGKTELLLLHAGLVDLLPDLNVVGLTGALDSSLVLLEVDEGGSQLGPVGDAGVEDLGGLVETLLLAKLVHTGVAESESSVDGGLAQRLPGHAQVLDEILVLASADSGLNDLLVVLGVLSLDVRLDGVANTETVKLGFGHLAPDFGQVDLLGVSLGTVDAHNVLNQDVNSGRLVASLLKDLEGLLVETDFDTGGRDVGSAEVVQTVDVVHNLTLVGLGSGEQKQVLKVGVVAERRRLKDDLLKQLNKLEREIAGEEGGDSLGDLGRVGRLRNGGGSHLVNHGAAVDVVLAENKGPQLAVSPLKQVASLVAVHAVLILFADGESVILVVLLEELLRVVVRVDVNLGESVEDGLLLVAGSKGGLEEGQEKLETVARLNLRDELIDGDRGGVYSRQQVLDDALVAVDIQETTNDGRRSAGVDTLDVSLDGLELLLLVKVENQVVDEVESVANDDEGQLLLKSGLLQEVLDLLGVVVVAVSANALNLVELAHLGGSLDVLEVNVGVLGKVDDAAEVVEETLGSLVLLEKVNQADRTKQIGVLGRDLDYGLEILADVVLDHRVQAVQGLLNGQLAEETGQPVKVEVGGGSNVDYNTLDRRGVLVELQGLLGQASLFTESRNASLVEVGEHVVSKNGIGNLGRIHQVHLEETSLKVTLVRSVVLERIQEEGSCLLDHALGLENVDDSLNVNQRTALVVGQSRSELRSLLRVDTNNVLEKLNVVGLVANLGGVGQDLIELASLSKASNDLVGNVGLNVHGKGHVQVVGPHKVTEPLRWRELVLLLPLLEQVETVLGKNRLSQFN
ncbi:uncharacterized protein ColSpa_00617 [Colletotrichum spaethianum]|uniref:Uncharacterized protein n=1 Tax=Colletotrichum spaethianum TaxID=700344 RepID=A0AA37L1X0_9PEZI|nr:uncharacterized protein ColSpa_00617 [Colletotrichum spaethianum]GKT40436.1 hypothetical protein ColSpa_00617 [Colletotrichum spaethianum]